MCGMTARRKRQEAEIYMAYHQHPWVSDEMHVVLRSNSDVAVVTREAEKIAAALNPEVSLSFGTMQTFLGEAVATPRFRTVLDGRIRRNSRIARDGRGLWSDVICSGPARV